MKQVIRDFSVTDKTCTIIHTLVFLLSLKASVMAAVSHSDLTVL